MTQRMQLHPPGTFPECPDCGDELRHVHDERAVVGGHFMSCCCGDSPKFGGAEAMVEALHGWCAQRGVTMPAVIDVGDAPGQPPAQSVELAA